MTQPTAQDILMGGGGRMFSWAVKQPDGSYLDKPPGTNVSGFIEGQISQAQQTDIRTGALQTWPDGKPKMQAIVPIRTQLREDADDDGLRTLWIKQSSNLQAAIRDAVKAAGAKFLEAGGWIGVTFTGTRPASQAGMNPIKIYEVQYTPPAQGTIMDGAQPATQPAQPQYAPQQPAQPQYAPQQPAQPQYAPQQPPAAPPQVPVTPQQPLQAPLAGQYPTAQPGAPVPPQQPPAAAPAAGPDPNAVAVQLIGLGTMTDEQIATVTGLTPDQVKAHRPPY